MGCHFCPQELFYLTAASGIIHFVWCKAWTKLREWRRARDKEDINATR